jgi:hypothetical protein
LHASNRTFAFEVVEDLELLVSYQGRRNPSDDEWDRYVQVLARLHQSPKDYRYFTVSEGGHPSGPQQARVKAAVNGRTPAVAIVSSSIAIRFVGSVLALVNHKVQCFRPDQLARAYAHIALPSRDGPRLEAVLTRLRASVSTVESYHPGP